MEILQKNCNFVSVSMSLRKLVYSSSPRWLLLCRLACCSVCLAPLLPMYTTESTVSRYYPHPYTCSPLGNQEHRRTSAQTLPRDRSGHHFQELDHCNLAFYCFSPCMDQFLPGSHSRLAIHPSCHVWDMGILQKNCNCESLSTLRQV